ncbi:hypothetical protein BDR05DRAFT_1061045 [Suillus weaverae]|nr:hypothetical protein BDR05DRAFT_1061045 [Suillus weaverae]
METRGGGLADEKEDDPKTDEDEGGPTDHGDTKEDDTKTTEEESSLYEDEKDDPKTDEEGDMTHYGDEKDDNIKTDEEESTHYKDEKEDKPKIREGDPTDSEDKKDDPKIRAILTNMLDNTILESFKCSAIDDFVESYEGTGEECMNNQSRNLQSESIIAAFRNFIVLVIIQDPVLICALL